MYNFKVEYRPGNQMGVPFWGYRSPCNAGEHKDFIKKNSEMGITVKSLHVKQLDLHDPKLEDLAGIRANDPEYQQMNRHLETGIQKIQLEEDSELRKMLGDSPNLELHTLPRAKLIVKNGNNIMIPEEARASILKELHSTHLGTEIMKNNFRGRFFLSRIKGDPPGNNREEETMD